MARERVRIGIPGNFTPPMDALLKNAQRNEGQGYDMITWPDHWMGWSPQAIWSPDIGEIAGRQKNSDIFFDCMTAIAAAAMVTQKVRLMTSVTEPVRRHPAGLAQEMLTLSHISKGRVILGIGAGEGENIIPYGLDFSKPAGRLEEAIKIIRLLWESEGLVNYDGKFWKLDRAVLGLEPYEGKFPPIWIAAHGPRMLEMTGRLGDGWYPSRLQPAEYGEKLATIKRVAEAQGRDFSRFEASMYTYVVVSKTHEEAHRLVEHPLVKTYCMMVPEETFARFGAKHPLGRPNGMLDFIPSHYSRSEALEAIGKIPPEVAQSFIIHGTAEDIADELSKLAENGLQHAVLENLTPLGDLGAVRSSYEGLAEVVKLLS